MRILLFILLSILLSEVHSQQCSCTTYTQIKRNEFQKHIDEADFKSAELISDNYIQNKDFSCQLTGLDQRVVIYMHQGKFDSAKIYLDKQKPILAKVPCNKNAKMEYLTSMAEYHFVNGNLKKGAELTINALKIAEETNNVNRQALLYSYLSTAFSRMEMTEKQIEYARRAIHIIPKIEEPRDAVNHIRSIANAYKTHYWKKKLKSSLDSMFIFGNEVLSRSRKLNYSGGLIEGYLLRNEFESAGKNYASALKFIDSASYVLNSSTDIGRTYQYWYKIYFDKSFCLNEMGKHREAAQFADSTIKYALISGESAIISSSYKKGYEAYQSIGNYKTALEYFVKHRSLQDSLSTVENKNIVTELEQKYEKSQNLKKIKEEKQKNELLQKENRIQELNNRFLVIIVFASILFILLLVFVLRQRRIKNRQDLMEAEMRLNRSRMNPHFFFNALTALQGLAVRENDGKKVATKLFQFSALMRQSLESTYTNFITVEEEIEFLKKYLEVAKIRDENLFSYSFEIDPEMEPEHLQIPSMLLQPFIENSIEHGFKKQDRKGELIISFKVSDNILLVEIKDNGPGLGHAGKKENHVSRAMQITRDRLYLLNQKKQGNYRFEISNRSDTSGVVVNIWLPLLEK